MLGNVAQLILAGMQTWTRFYSFKKANSSVGRCSLLIFLSAILSSWLLSAELYEEDADIGNQHFDLKLTGRVRMRMVGVPEAVTDFWIAKFLAAGYKVGKVEQAETAIGADLRRSDDKVCSAITCPEPG